LECVRPFDKQLAALAAPVWRLVGTRPCGTLCHKPCTVSGGGKSEISKSIASSLIEGPVFVPDYHRDMEAVPEILKKDF
jgi:phosphoenolpyruvate carboxykinase (diphosphate)